MSVLIKGMEKPKDCYSCPFADNGWPDEWEMRCLFLDRQVGYFGKKLKVPKDCPLVEVPTPHGTGGQEMRDYKELVERLHKRIALTTAGSSLQNDLLEAADAIEALLISAQLAQRWVPCKDRLPENTEPVNITWVNHKPARYYADIKDIPFTATGCCCDRKWYWYSATCQDYLDEYGYSGADLVDDEIEVIAWMPLPEPYKEEV